MDANGSWQTVGATGGYRHDVKDPRLSELSISGVYSPNWRACPRHLLLIMYTRASSGVEDGYVR